MNKKDNQIFAFFFSSLTSKFLKGKLGNLFFYFILFYFILFFFFGFFFLILKKKNF